MENKKQQMESRTPELNEMGEATCFLYISQYRIVQEWRENEIYNNVVEQWKIDNALTQNSIPNDFGQRDNKYSWQQIASFKWVKDALEYLSKFEIYC